LFGERTIPLNVRQIINKNTAKKLILLPIEDITGGKLIQALLNYSSLLNHEKLFSSLNLYETLEDM